MSSRLRANAVPLITATLAIWIVGRLTLYGWALTDYDYEARPSFDALVHGHLLSFLQLAPSYGGSLVIRAPFVLATKLWHGGELSIYRAAAAPCLIASAAFGLWLVARMRKLGYPRSARAVALALCVANPLTLPAMEIGHPEELLGAVLCVGAVLAAIDDRPVWAGVLLGLAVANKEWAVLTVGPVLIGLPGRRVRAMLIAGAVAGAIVAPLITAGGFVSGVRGTATQANVIFNPWQVWWFFGSHAHVIRDAAGHIIPGHRWNHRVEPSWVGTISHPLIVAVALPLTLLCVRMRRRRARRPVNEALLLLALLLMLRCILDPWDMPYYFVPFLLALTAWDSLTFARPPVLALAASFATWFAFEWTLPSHGFSPDMQSLVFVLFAIPVLVAIWLALYMPGVSARFAPRIGRREVIPTAA